MRLPKRHRCEFQVFCRAMEVTAGFGGQRKSRRFCAEVRQGRATRGVYRKSTVRVTSSAPAPLRISREDHIMTILSPYWTISSVWVEHCHTDLRNSTASFRNNTANFRPFLLSGLSIATLTCEIAPAASAIAPPTSEKAPTSEKLPK